MVLSVHVGHSKHSFSEASARVMNRHSSWKFPLQFWQINLPLDFCSADWELPLHTHFISGGWVICSLDFYGQTRLTELMLVDVSCKGSFLLLTIVFVVVGDAGFLVG